MVADELIDQLRRWVWVLVQIRLHGRVVGREQRGRSLAQQQHHEVVLVHPFLELRGGRERERIHKLINKNDDFCNIYTEGGREREGGNGNGGN